jgi:hypothetical protein
MNGNGDAPKAVCIVVLAMVPGGAGLQIIPQPAGETIERQATLADLASIAAQLAQWCQTQAIAQELRRPQPGLVVPR